MDDYIRSMIYSMECSLHRMKWYQETNEPKYLVDSEMYLRVCNIYMKEIMSRDSMENLSGSNHETCESIN